LLFLSLLSVLGGSASALAEIDFGPRDGNSFSRFYRRNTRRPFDRAFFLHDGSSDDTSNGTSLSSPGQTDEETSESPSDPAPQTSEENHESLDSLEIIIWVGTDKNRAFSAVLKIGEERRDRNRARTLLRELLLGDKKPPHDSRVQCRIAAASALATLGLNGSSASRSSILKDLLKAAKTAREPYAVPIAQALVRLTARETLLAMNFLDKLKDLSAVSPEVIAEVLAMYSTREATPDLLVDVAKFMLGQKESELLAMHGAKYLVLRGLELETAVPKLADPETIRTLKEKAIFALMACPNAAVIPHPVLEKTLIGNTFNLDLKREVAVWLLNHNAVPSADIAHYAARSLTHATEESAEVYETLTRWVQNDELKAAIVRALEQEGDERQRCIRSLLGHSPRL
jgi:hypothetical protein